jgi:hypothetical protein
MKCYVRSYSTEYYVQYLRYADPNPQHHIHTIFITLLRHRYKYINDNNDEKQSLLAS